MAKQPSSTKKGPGRRHEDGHEKASPVKRQGAPFGFVQHTNQKRAHRRALIAIHGRRQFLLMERSCRREKALVARAVAA